MTAHTIQVLVAMHLACVLLHLANPANALTRVRFGNNPVTMEVIE